MGVTPITPQLSDVNGQAITVAVAVTSTGAGAETCTLPSYMPKIDIRIAHPVLDLMHLVIEDDTASSSDVFLPGSEMQRGTAPDSAGEWDIEDASSLKFYSGADKDGILFITYIPFGVQLV